MTIEGKLIIFENIEDRILDMLKHASHSTWYPTKAIQFDLAQKDCKISYSTLNRHLKNMTEKRILNRICLEGKKEYYYRKRDLIGK